MNDRSSPSDADADAQPDGRRETHNERLDRHWADLLQELRVTQTGTQILTGFLLALAFQPAFADLDRVQTGVYLTLVCLAVLATVTGLAPVSSHRVLYGRLVKERVVAFGDVLLRITLVTISLLLVGVVFFLFDVVLDRTAGLVAGALAFAVLVALWLVAPLAVRRLDDSDDITNA
ncbi:hypothetical protein CLV49_3466 [Labedella gwakjiensis]|uniref:Sodium:proton antiporter n=1 Tax=Labedella gwakjiensis TaxID=390269 RepID=A0A2P8H0T5_9MICO|nr:DUF6328 family protein [Labedella gwakjiensis]PSL39816.1 hypothetical protein CLV49_3466 [Labedella gwakjiensis]RUQ85807.1 sodium:proton antiporter [Labedella gwakjiensis]